MPVRARIVKRAGQDKEDFHIQTYTPAKEFYEMGFCSEQAQHVKIVCYSAEALLENGGKRSTDCDFEIITIIASPVEKEPMMPLTMSRNQLGLPGGTKGDYTWRDYAEASVYWSKRIKIVAE